MSNYRFTHIALFLFVTLLLRAVPARRDAFVVNQPDGSSITLFNHGDEIFHYLTDTAGNIVTQDEHGFYVVDNQNPRLNSSADMSEKRVITDRRLPAVISPNIAEHGLIILANFADQTFLPENSLESMRDMFCGLDYTYNGATGSARQYFYDQSFGIYNPQFDVVGPVNLPHPTAFYGSNNRVGEEPKAYLAIRDACMLADSLYDIDFSIYDNNHDGEMDFVFVVYAGHNEAEGGSNTTIWPHAWSLINAGLRLKIDDVLIGRYACSSELRDNKGEERAGIGTFCHEFSHVLGLPDLYATNLLTHRTLGAWDILDYGPYNNNGRTPPAYSAYERFFLGWAKPVLLNQPNDYILRDIKTNNACAMITLNGESNLSGNNPDPEVFFLLENRQRTAWDTYLPGHGLMITKIQFDENKWQNNTVNNNADDMGVDIIEAAVDSMRQTGSLVNLYPHGATSYVPSVLYPILDIAENEGVITFRFMSGSEGREPVEIIGTASTGTDKIFSPQEQIISITDLNGKKICTSGVGQERDISPSILSELPHGVYIISTETQSYKIVI